MDALTCIATRRSIPRLVAPGPTEAQLGQLLAAAVAAPDHGQLRPWHFVVVSGEGLGRLGALFAEAHAQREPQADVGALEKTAAKPLRAPMVIAVVARPVDAVHAWNGKDLPAWEQEAAVAAAVQNLCLAAHALGLGAMWRTGWFGDAPLVREALRLAPADRVVGWVYVGTVPPEATLPPRRPTDLDEVVTRWR